MAVTLEEVQRLYSLPFLDLLYEAATVHRTHHDPNEVQQCTLLSIKTGGCPEDCGYCAQSLKFETGVKRETLLSVKTVLQSAREAKESGASRFCLGAAWSDPGEGRAFDRVLEMVQGIHELGLESCVTLGKLNKDQALRLKGAGLYAYNHNIDTSREHYPNVVSTHTFDDRLETIANASAAGLSLCCGGILGIGETPQDRVSFLHSIANLNTVPESIPINKLVPVDGTPLSAQTPVDIFEWIRVIAVARILVPTAMIRLAAGRLEMTDEAQALAHLAGANSIFTGAKLLTTPNPPSDSDFARLKAIGMTPRAPFKGLPVATDVPTAQP